MNLLVVLFPELFALLQSHHILLLVEVLHLEFSVELQDLLCLALSLGQLSHLRMEIFVQRFKVFLFLSLRHEKQGGKLRVVLLEGLQLSWRQELDVVGHTEIPLLLTLEILIVQHLLLILLDLLLFLLRRFLFLLDRLFLTDGERLLAAVQKVVAVLLFLSGD